MVGELACRYRHGSKSVSLRIRPLGRFYVDLYQIHESIPIRIGGRSKALSQVLGRTIDNGSWIELRNKQ